MNNNALYISYDGLTDPLGQSQVLPYIIGLSEKGYHITIISCEKKERFKHHEQIISDLCSKHKIKWKPLSYTKFPPVLSTLMDIIKIYLAAKRLQKQTSFAIVHCRSYISSLVGLAFKKKYKTKFIFDMRGFWADERIDGNIWKLSNPLYNSIYSFFKKKEKEFLILSDKIISLTENAKNEILSWNLKNVNEEKIVVIPCAADYNLFDLTSENKKNESKTKLGLENKYVISYLGSLGTWYLTEEMLHFFSILKKQLHDAIFLIVTHDDRNQVINISKKFGLSNHDFLIIPSSRTELPSIIHASDFSVFFIKPSYSKKASSPTKMGELMAMGIPILCNNNVGDVNLIVEETKAGICIDQLSEKSYAVAIKKMLDFKYSPIGTRNSSKQFYLLDNGINKYTKCYQELLP